MVFLFVIIYFRDNIILFKKNCVVSRHGNSTLGFDFMCIISSVISEKSCKLTEPPHEDNSTLIKFEQLMKHVKQLPYLVLGKCVLFSKCSFSSFDLSILNGKGIRTNYFKCENFETFLEGWDSPQ